MPTRLSLPLAVAGAIYVLLWSQLAWVDPGNFEGFDEWLTLSLTSRGLIATPHANRPFGLLWNLPAAILFPHSLVGAFLVYLHYLALSGVLVGLLLWRFFPEEPMLALLAGVFTATWAPSDPARLCAVYSSAYAGVTAALLATAVLLVEAARRGIPGLAVGAALLTFVSARSHEAALPLLAAAPLLGLRRGSGLRPAWLALSWLAVALAAALVATPLLGRAPDAWYQGSFHRADFSAAGLLSRALLQFRLHFLPLLSSPPRELLVAGVPIAAGAFLVFYALLARNLPSPGASVRKLAWTTLAGLGIAGLGYSAFVSSAAQLSASRTQFLAAPGAGLTLAAAICLVARPLLPRWRGWARALLGAWVVAVGSGRTVAMQAQWARDSFYPRQSQQLAQLVELAPDLSPGTLVVLLDESQSWPATFTFRHAVRYLYEGHAVGHSPSSPWQLFYPVFFGPEGVRCEPWPVIREAWRETPSLHRYDELVVVWSDRSGLLSLLERWPSGALPALPPGARYAPRERILARAAPARAWGVLTQRAAR